MSDVVHELIGDVDVITETLIVDGRTLKVLGINQGVLWFTFGGMCDQSLGAADYLALAVRYHTLLLSNIPVMTLEQRNEAKRFATLIDILCEHNVKCVCNAAAVPKALYPSGNVALEFTRTASRPSKMYTAQYLTRTQVA